MIDLFFSALLCTVPCPPRQLADSVVASSMATAPTFDGRASEREYGVPNLRLHTAAGDVRVWTDRHGGFLYVAATLPDSTFYWGDDFVVSIDPDGSADASPQEGDRQWYLRRTLDSSDVSSASSGRWAAPGQPAPVLGTSRHHTDWDVAPASSLTGWTIELRIRENAVKPGGASPRIAFRTYNDAPQGWWSWPVPAPGVSAQRVERSPSDWRPLVFR